MSVSLLLCLLLPLTNASEVAAHLTDYRTRQSFVLTGAVDCVTTPDERTFVLTDDSASVVLVDDRSASNRTFKIEAGDILAVKGHVSDRRSLVMAPCNKIVRLGQRSPSKPKEASISSVKAGIHDFRFVRVSGLVRESFRDEIDPHFTFLVLSDGADAVYATIFADEAEAASLRKLTGSRIAVEAICQPARAGQRRQLGRTLAICDADSITVLRRASTVPFDVPSIDSSTRHNPDQILAMGRRRIIGRVLAVRNRSLVILRDEGGSVHNVGLAEPAPPDCGSGIEAEGFAATDLYRVNLTSATWRTREVAGNDEASPPLDITAQELLLDGKGRDKLNSKLHGTTIRIRGTVLDIPATENNRDHLTLKCGDHTLPVDASGCRAALKGVSVGCQVEATGCCAVETENWHSYSAFPHATGIVLVLRAPGDLVIRAAPPWWTPGRLLAVIGSLATFLVLLFAWSLSLWRIAVRRGRALFRAQVETMGSELRVEERTRLAVELHDSISQNLTGVSMQIDAALRRLDTTPDRARHHLGIASRTLTSSREELRNCIWDLRSQAVEAKDMNEAVRRTLHQRLGGATLTVRFNVPRSRLTDNTAHALLRIIRELAANAVRHGRATEIKVAGTIDSERLLFSVSDNGRGFDPGTRPGVGEGHFGLQGIAERIRPFDGRMTIVSSAGRGCRVGVSLKMTNAGKETA